MSCSDSKNQDHKNEDPSREWIFPDDWLGCWSGDLKIMNHSGVVQEIPMELEHYRTDKEDEFGWAIIYGEEKDRRDYYLGVVDASKGHYSVDERNGIYLDSYHISNKLMSSYEVMGNAISSIYTREDDQLIFEIIFGSSEVTRVSGDTIIMKDTIPEVLAYPIKGYQKAILTKKIPCR